MVNRNKRNQAATPWELILKMPKWILVLAVTLGALVFLVGFAYSVFVPRCEVTAFGLSFGPKRDCGPILPSGAILPYYRTLESIPQGWAVCGDEQEETPNLDGRFLIGTRDLGLVGRPTGSRTHAHPFAGRSSFEAEGTDKGPEGADNYTDKPNWNHKHDISGDTQEVEHIPPSVNVLFLCKE